LDNSWAFAAMKSAREREPTAARVNLVEVGVFIIPFDCVLILVAEQKTEITVFLDLASK